MKYCVKCLQPDTRPGDDFGQNRICLGCKNFETNSTIDFESRFEVMEEILKKYKKNKNRMFDCIIGVSGGKDSTRQAKWVRDKLGLKPLLVCMSYPPEQINKRGAKNISNLIELGFDVLISAPAPEVFKRLTRTSFLKFGNMLKASELALYSSVPKIAINYKIPLIFNGEDQGQKEKSASGIDGWDNNLIINLNTLSGGDMGWILDEIGDQSLVLPYFYPKSSEFKKNKLQIVDLGWFLGDWSFSANGSYAVLDGLEPRIEPPEETGDPSFVSSLDEDWVSVNQLLKYFKFGYGKATDFVNEEIRYGRLSRNEGIRVVEKYDGCCNKDYIKSFCNYIKITEDMFWAVARKAVNRNLFSIDKLNRVSPKFKVGEGIES